MTPFSQRTDAVLAALTTFHTHYQSCWPNDPTSYRVEPTDGRGDLLINHVPIARKISTLKPQHTAHQSLALAHAAQSLSDTLADLEMECRTVPGYPHGILGLLVRVTHATDALYGTFCLEGAGVCPSGNGHEGTPLTQQAAVFAQQMEAARGGSSNWIEPLPAWWVRNGPSPTAPVREVFAPDSTAALAADGWWHWRTPPMDTHQRVARPAPGTTG